MQAALLAAIASDLSCGQRDDLLQIVGLNFHVVRRLISANLTAFGTTVDDNISLLGIG